MKIGVYSVFDSKAEVFSQPMFMGNRGQAIRSFQDEINRDNKESLLHKHPADFSLFEIGFWDNEKGVFENLKAPANLGNGLSFVDPKMD